MSKRERSESMETDDLADVQFLHNAERAESAWLLARENDPSAPPPSPEIAADYAEIEDLLGSLPSGFSDESWQEDVLRALATSTRPARPWWRTTRFRWAMGGALATTAAAAVVVLMLLPRAPEFEVAIRHLGTTRGGSDEVGVGDRLVVTARLREAGELCVYRSDGPLVARCPNGPGCTGGSHGAQTIDIALDAPVPYRVLLVEGVCNAPPNEVMDVHVDATPGSNARIIRYQQIDVH